VSDFLLQSFFAAGAAGPYSFMGSQAAAPSGPFAVAAGGYQIKRDSGGNESQVTGSVRPIRAAKQSNWSSRVYRRGARV
jgi:hypothetical protein